MSVVGRLKQGDMIVGSEIDERLPSITDGLVAHFPFDDTEKGIRYKNILDYSTWGDSKTGNVPGFTVYSSNNERVMGTDPWGKPTIVWQGISSDTSTASTGVYSGRFQVDPTKMYRMSWWEKRVTNGSATSARYYAGMNAYGSVNGVRSRTTGTNSTNPYFHLAHNLPVYPKLAVGEWTLVVAHVWPHDSGTGASHKDTGIYTIDEGKIGPVYYSDFVWNRETTQAMSRTLSLYVPNAGGVIHQSCYPRVDLCDGSEPTIQDLLMGEGNVYNTNPTETSRSQLGIGVGAATINLLRNGISPYTSYHDFEQLGNRYKFTMKGNNRFIVFSINDAGRTQGMTFSASGIMKQNGRPIGLAGDRMNTYNSVSDNKMYYSDPKTGEFKITETMGGSSSWMFHMPTRSVDGDIITIDEFQIELGSYSTPFVEDSRSDGQLDIPFNLKPPYTINFWHKGLKPNSTSINQAESPMILQMNSYNGTPSISIWKYYKNLRIYTRGDNSTVSWSSNKDYHAYTDADWDNQWHMYTFTAQDMTTFLVYMDGKHLGSQVSSDIISNITFLSMGNVYQPNAIYKDMSLYDKRLSAAEIEKLYRPSMNMSKDGVIKTEINEGLKIDNNSPHWLSLGDSTISEDERMTPIIDDNAAFEDGAFWAGNATENLYSINSNTRIWGNNSSNMASLTEVTGPNSIKIKGVCDVPGSYTFIYPTVSTKAVHHSFQAKATNNGHNHVRVNIHIRDGNNGTQIGDALNVQVPPGETMHLRVPADKPATTTTVTPSILVNSDSVDGTIDIDIFDIQLEQSPFCSPFVEGSRGQTRLSYPPVISGKHFSLSMWVKQIAADNVYNMPFDAYASQLYVAMRDTMRLHFSFTNNGSQASLLSPADSTTLNKWHHIGAIKTTSKLEMYLDGELVNTYTATGTGFTMTCSDIHIGSYNTDYPFNGYIRDVIIDVDNKYLSKDKMKEIYKTQMRSFKNNETTVSGQIIEGGDI